MFIYLDPWLVMVLVHSPMVVPKLSWYKEQRNRQAFTEILVNLITHYSRESVGIIWQFKKCLLRIAYHCNDLLRNITSALNEMGYFRPVFINVVGDNTSYNKIKPNLVNQNITFTPATQGICTVCSHGFL